MPGKALLHELPALALPEDVGGMLLDDGGVEVACTPLHAVASVARHDVVGAPRDNNVGEILLHDHEEGRPPSPERPTSPRMTFAALAKKP